MNPFKRMVKRLQERKQEKKEKQEDIEKLEKWKKRLDKSMESHNAYRNNVAEWDTLYNGTKSVAPIGYVSNRDRMHPEDARSVVNIVLQLVEAGVDISIPMPRVNAIEGDDEAERQKMIDGMLTYLAESPEMERVTSENERIVKKNGQCFLKLHYDPDYHSHKFRGRIKFTNPHPVNIIPQPNVYRVQDMDYLFHIEQRTMDQVERMYGGEKRQELEDESAEYAYIEDMSATTTQSSTDTDRVSVVEAWYKDKDGDVGVLTWANGTILKDTPKFYYKRDAQGNVIETEIVTIDQYDDAGNLISSQEVEVRCHVPKRFPFVVWYNIPKEKSFRGISDIAIIKDMQEAIKKLLTIEEEKQIKGTTKVIVKKGSRLNDLFNNATLQVMESENPQLDVRVIDLKTSDRGIKDLYQIYLQAAKDMLGITEAYQGRAEGSNLSGKALEMLAQNTAGKLAIKTFEKNIAFQELYELAYDFMLAFYDDRIPYRLEGSDGNYQYGYFDKSLLIKQDDAGEYYYPEFDIYIDVDQGLPRDKRFVMEIVNQAAQSGQIDPIGYWTIMEAIGVPSAGQVLERARQMSAGKPMDIVSQLPPDAQQAFQSAPPDIQQQLLSQIGDI